MQDIEQIEAVLPHRYPFLLVDRIVEHQEGEKIVGIKNVTRNEEIFNGHYPGHPIMPGVLIVEAMAQVAGYGMLAAYRNREQGNFPYFAGIDSTRFRRPVVPGDQLRIEVFFLRLRERMAKVQSRATVEDEVAAEAELMFAMKRDGST